MGLSRKNRKIQASIADALKKGLPLAGLLSSLMVTSGCDAVKGIIRDTKEKTTKIVKRVKGEEEKKEEERPLMGFE